MRRDFSIDTLLLICLSLPIIYTQTLPSCFIHRQANNNGFHRELQTDISLESSPENQLESCQVVLAENISSSFYFDLDQIEMLYDMGAPLIYSEQKIDVEKPAVHSSSHLVYVYQDLTLVKSEHGRSSFAANFSVPFHLRYHQSSTDQTHYFSADLQPPNVFIHCRVDSLELNASYDIPCGSSPEKQCKSTALHCV
ncbi:hypothetical protein CAPTEDRAFT_190749, partial [Capitella teleta]